MQVFKTFIHQQVPRSGKGMPAYYQQALRACEALQKLSLSYEGTDFSVTITIGAEENDFHSSLVKILEQADEKLYMGKVQGRNRVII